MECAECTGLSRGSTRRRYLEHLVSAGAAEMRPRYGAAGRRAPLPSALTARALVGVGPPGIGAVVRPARGRSGGGQPVADGGQRGVPGREDVLLGELAGPAGVTVDEGSEEIAWCSERAAERRSWDWFVKAR